MAKLKLVSALIASFCLFFLFANDAHATHFRYGNIRYTVPDPVTSPTTVRFDVIVAWRQAFVDTVTFQFGDGTQALNVSGTKIGEGVDVLNEAYQVQRYTVTHTYPSPGTFTSFFTSCCRISSLTDANQHDSNFRIEAIVDLTPGNTGNAVSAVPAIFQLQAGGVRTIDIPAIDPDGAPVHCRFGTPGETSTPTMPAPIPGGALPTLTDTPTGCQFSWNLAQAQANQKFAINIVIESFNGPTRSDAMLDFIIEIVTSPPPSCTGGGVYNVDLGTSFSQSLVGTNIGGGMLKMTSIGTFGNLSPVPGTSMASPFTTTYKISPSIGDQGVGLMTVVYANAQHLSGFCTVLINTPQCAVFGDECSSGIGGCKSDGFMYCLNGATACSAVEGQPEPEKCDMIDNNCDGAVDEGDPETGDVCTSMLPGLCSAGTALCNAGVLDCIPDIKPGEVPETCDGVDQDCDGTVDNGFNVGGTCLKGDGMCLAAGKFVCDGNGGAVCDADPAPPTMEVCDGKDNDCNQVVDDGFPLGDACTSGVGLCTKAGVIVCDGNGATKCDAVPDAPGVEVCGNKDDEDCDGALDNDCLDSDKDGLFDVQEIAAGTDPQDADSDDDGLLDGLEPNFADDTDSDGLINALDPDSDDDALFDGTEMGKNCDDPATKLSAGFCIADADPKTTTDPLLEDSDAAGAQDGSEDFNLDGKVDAGESDASSPSDDDKVVDTDSDGLSDGLEKTLGLDPNDLDSDDDGLLDGLEANPSCDSDGDGLRNGLDVDSDNDALFDGTEAGKDCNHADTKADKKHCHFDGDPSTITGVLAKDTDHGGVFDGSEDVNLNGVFGASDTDPNDLADDVTIKDADGDGLSDALELTLGSDLNDIDSDNDGVFDGDEANPSDDADLDGQPNLMDPDADGDGIFDGTELGLGCSDPATDSSQGFCIPDADTGKSKTHPLLADTDKGGIKDGDEDKNHNGVVDEGETDPNDGSDDVLPECDSDGQCGAVNSGKVCVEQKCVPGCRGAGGNTCPAGQVCSSENDLVGTCMTETGTGGTGGTGGETGDPLLPGGGCGCRVTGDGDDGALGLLALAGLAALAGTRRRKR